MAEAYDIVVDDTTDWIELSPGVHMFYGYDRDEGRMKRYKAIDYDSVTRIEDY